MTDNNKIPVFAYFAIYLILVFLVFFLLYWGFSYTINEGEAFAIALLAGLIFLAVFFDNFKIEENNKVQQCTEKFLADFLVYGLVTFTLVFLLAIGVGFFTFGKTCHHSFDNQY